MQCIKLYNLVDQVCDMYVHLYKHDIAQALTQAKPKIVETSGLDP